MSENIADMALPPSIQQAYYGFIDLGDWSTFKFSRHSMTELPIESARNTQIVCETQARRLAISRNSKVPLQQEQQAQ